MLAIFHDVSQAFDESIARSTLTQNEQTSTYELLSTN